VGAGVADLAAGTVRALVRLVRDGIEPLLSGAASEPVLTREALVDAAIDVQAAQGGLDLLDEWASRPLHSAGVYALCWRLSHSAGAILAELLAGVPRAAARPAAALAGLPDVLRAGPDPVALVEASAEALVARPGAVELLDALREQLAGGRRHPDLPERLIALLDTLRVAARREWEQPGDVRLAGMPYLLTPLADAIQATALVRWAQRPQAPESAAVVARRFGYRRLAGPAPEGLTDRHLLRTGEVLRDARIGTAR
jgi:hypothetical protein